MAKQPALVFFACMCSVLFFSRPSDAKEKITFTPKESSQQQAKPETCEIKVFQEAKPEQAYVELGIINYHDERHRTNAGTLKRHCDADDQSAGMQGRRRRAHRHQSH